MLPHDVAVLLEKLPAGPRAEVTRRLATLPAVAPVDPRVLGRAYEKQVDVVIARWDRGPELLISTKAQLSSFGRNLPNRHARPLMEVCAIGRTHAPVHRRELRSPCPRRHYRLAYRYRTVRPDVR